jgi:hypothetical protein
MSNSYEPPEVWNEGKSKEKLIKRMVKAHKKKKRQEKIDALQDDPKMWKNLE